ncbi:MAG: fatty acid oxidation complex subunit alpha FadJ [Armatimonadetes bacterium]|nr:fatty acid oxidation complex subunit alpha FadJ [Armatimonadota bacterium]
MTVAEMAEQATRLTVNEKGIARLELDCPGTRLNILSPDVFRELNDRFDELSGREGVRALVISSAKKGSFIAGADINTIGAIETLDQGEELSRQAQLVFQKLDDLPFPTVCAIDGVCLGGGLELALAADYRLVSDEDRTALGLPEVQLGLIPGAGGTQRLPRLIGLPDALDMILTGRNMRAKKARKLGLADEVVPVEILEQRALEAADELAHRKGMARDLLEQRQKGLTTRVLESFAGRSLVYSQAKATLRKKTGGHYPAPFKALEATRAASRKSLQEGLEIEARLFGEATVTRQSKALIHLFNSFTGLKSETGLPEGSEIRSRKVKRTAVLGGGLMGSGIATVLASVGYPVRLKDIDKKTLGKSLSYAHKVYSKDVERRRIRPFDRDLKLSRIRPTVDYSGFSRTDIVIEAVFEDLDIKHRVIQEVEAVCGPETIFASNTSSIPIEDIARASKRPENVIGMHFFSPVEKMQLVEIIVHPKTAEWVTATTVDLAKKMKKHVIVVNDGAGFYTSRVLAAFCLEAVRILYDGAAIDAIDRAITGFGFPVGPLILMDEVGIDVVTHVMAIMTEAFPGRFLPPTGWERLSEDGRLGKKNKRGFYSYKAAVKEPDHSIYSLLPGGRQREDVDPALIQERCVFAFLNEAALCLEENVLRSPRDGDVAAIFGLGFPPFLGGPFFHMDQIGLPAVVEKLESLQKVYGDSFKPARLLVDMAREGKTFF